MDDPKNRAWRFVPAPTYSERHSDVPIVLHHGEWRRVLAVLPTSPRFRLLVHVAQMEGWGAEVQICEIKRLNESEHIGATQRLSFDQ